MVDYPPAVARQSAGRRDAWVQSQVTTILQRDVRDLANVGDTTAVPRLLCRGGSPRGRTAELRRPLRTMALSQKIDCIPFIYKTLHGRTQDSFKSVENNSPDTV
jgi:hypothetical protein